MTLSRTFAAAFFAAALAAAPAQAQELKPYQKAALEKILATVDPDMRPMMRQQLIPTLAVLNEAQVQAMVDGMTAGLEEAEDDEVVENDDYEATEDDLKFNEQQYEPVIKKLWTARRECEAYAAKSLEENDPGVTYAIWGEAWRYEVRELKPQVETVYADYEMYAMLYRGAAPTDGRYQFNFSTVDTNCNRDAIDRAVKKAYADYTKLGQEFMAQVKAYKGSEANRRAEGDGGYDIESNANARVGKLQQATEKAIGDAMPQGDQSLMNAMMVTAKRLR